MEGGLLFCFEGTQYVFIFRNFMDIQKQNVLIQKPVPQAPYLCGFNNITSFTMQKHFKFITLANTNPCNICKYANTTLSKRNTTTTRIYNF